MSRSTIDLRLLLRDDADSAAVLELVADLVTHGDVILAQIKGPNALRPSAPRDGWTRTWETTS